MTWRWGIRGALSGVIVAAAAVGSGLGGAAPLDATRDTRVGVVVVLRSGVDPLPTIRALERRHDFASRFRYTHSIKGFAALLTAGQRARVEADPRVRFVAPDTLVERATLEELMPGETVPTGARRMGAVLASARRGVLPDVRRASNVAVAVLDTGVDLDHPDLNVVDGTDCIFPGTSADDDHGHGTHVAGTIGARNVGFGVVGVSPGTTIYAVKVLFANQSTPVSHIICGIDWVTANASSLGIEVVNMSLGGAGASDQSCGATNSDAMHAAICASTAAGVTYVVAAGNDAINLANRVPAAYPEVLTVTAISDKEGLPGGTGGNVSCPNSPTPNGDDAAASFSNYATTPSVAAHVVAAPGKCILSTWAGGAYATISGTSMASPHVAGTVALCFGSGGGSGPCAGLTPAQIISRVRADAAAAPAGYGFTGVPGRLYGDLVRASVFR